MKKWIDDRGFGFIKPDDGGKDVFLHINVVKKASRRPQVGDTIFYEQITEPNGKIRATKAVIQGVPLSSQSPPKRKQKSQFFRDKKRQFLFMGVFIALVAHLIFAPESLRLNRFRSVVSSITKPGCNIKGNISQNNGTKWYHLPGMEDYEATVIDTSQGEKWFCTESEAINEGWQKAPR